MARGHGATVAEVRRLARGAPVSRDRVHTLHRSLRRARLERRLLGDRTPLARERALERALGHWRDLQLFGSILRQHAPPRATGRERTWIARQTSRLAADTVRARREAIARAAQLARGARAKRRATAGPPRERKARRGVSEALRQARVRLSAERGHALRKALRRLTVAIDLGRAMAGRPPHRRPSELRTLVAALGRLHDLDVARSRLGPGASSGGRRWIHSMDAARRSLRNQIRSALRGRVVPAYVRGSR